MAKQTILVIDDDATLRELVAGQLQSVGYRTLCSDDGPSGLRLCSEPSVNLVVLDVMMPAMDGWEVCRRIRQYSAIPIILLTAKGEEIDKLHGFRLGIDDYVTKPFSLAELVARVGAVLTRTGSNYATTHTTSSGDLTVDFDQRRVTVSGQVVELTPTEYRILEFLTRHPHRTISNEQLLNEVWGPAYTGDADQVKHFIWTIRKKIESDPGDPKHLVTERGFGYRFE